MGDISAEPSMEDILSSIKRIIAEEGDGQAPRARRAPTRSIAPAPALADDDADEEVLELNDPIAAAPRVAAAPAPAPAPPKAEERAPHVSAATVEATRGALDTLSRLIVKPEPDSDGTLEGLVRDMLRPMLSGWLDRNLPPIVEQMVAREIAKITANQS